MSIPPPPASAADRTVEFTVRGVLLGVLITLVFTAAQVYLGLQVGLTFATSIPAAVISMALLQGFKSATIQENNIVQTIASAAGTLAAVIFVLPGLIMIGWWQNVPFFTTFAACALGGILGVMYSMPLRRALVVQSSLPYPEGVAAAEVLKVGTASRSGQSESRTGLLAVVWGSVASAVFSLLVSAKVFAGEIAAYFKIGPFKGEYGATGLAGESSLALFGAGHLMGVTVGAAMLVGLVIAWGIGVPILSVLNPMPDLSLADHAGTIWSTKVRFLGAGAIAASALWTLGRLIGPVWGGLMSSLRQSRLSGVDVPRQDRDLPITLVGAVIVATMVPVGWLLMHFLSTTPLTSIGWPLVLAGVAFVLIAGLIAAAVAGYMAGLIGASNSPVSGMAILSILGAALMIGLIGHALTGPDEKTALIAFALFVTTLVLAVAVIGNDNLQDLKTGHMVGATPWKQQMALIIGVIAGSVVVPLVLELLNASNGFAGDPNYHAVTGEPLKAPQATLISTIAKGVIGGDLDWGLLGVGALLGMGLVVTDLLLKGGSKDRLSLPPLGVALAIYLPSSVTLPVIIGAFAGWVFERLVRGKTWEETAKQLGVLIASGMIVGESLFKVVLAAVIVITKQPAPLALPVELGETLGMGLASAAAFVVVLGLYRWAVSSAKSQA